MENEPLSPEVVKVKLNDLNVSITTPDKILLEKLEEANRKIESDSRSPLSSLLLKNEQNNNGDTAGPSNRPPSPTLFNLLSNRSSSPTLSNRPGSPTSFKEMDEVSLWSLWSSLIANWPAEMKKRPQYIKDLVKHGIPQHFRAIVWQLLVGGDLSDYKKQYAHYIKANSACEKVIRRDIARTYPEHEFFKEKDGLGQEALFNVMKAYSVHDREVGYCQGSGFIVGLLLMQMPEEDAFAVLVQIMQKYRMRDMFKPSMAELGLCMFQLENLVQELLPDLYAHFQAQNFETTMYASRWFLTLFATSLSQKLACRIMDVFLSEGFDIVFKVALALLHIGLADLLSQDMEGMQKYFQTGLPKKVDLDPEWLMKLAYSIKVNPKTMKKLEKEYTNIKTKEQKGQAQLRCLREENRLLRQRVELLEKECASLAEKLVDGQVHRAEGEEESFVLSRELQVTRRELINLQQRLSVSEDERRSLEMMLSEKNQDNSNNSGSTDSCDQELARTIQRELVRARLEIAEREAVERELRSRINELEDESKSLRNQQVDNNVAHLQDELIAIKLREAEANLSLKEMRQRITEISDAFSKFQIKAQENRPPSPQPQQKAVLDVMSTPKKLLRAWGAGDMQRQLEEELMASRLREAEAVSELKELRLRIMQLETQVNVSTNQLRRLDEECEEMRQSLEAALQRERNLIQQAKDAARKYIDLESMTKYQCVQANIRTMEDAQRIAELETKVSEYKIHNEVMATVDELRINLDESEDIRELHERVAELRAEVSRLEAFKAKALGRQISTISLSEESEEEHQRQADKLKLNLRRDSSSSQETSQANLDDLSNNSK